MNESHVIAALIGADERQRWRAENTIRLSLGKATTAPRVHCAARELSRIIKEMPVSQL